jgi:rRNA maturation protein Nop10
VNLPVTLESCPACGGKLAEKRVDFTYITGLPLLPQPKVTQYRVWVCQCTECGRKVRGEHPDLAPAQYGATAIGWGRGLWPPPMPCITRWGFRYVRCP